MPYAACLTERILNAAGARRYTWFNLKQMWRFVFLWQLGQITIPAHFSFTLAFNFTSSSNKCNISVLRLRLISPPAQTKCNTLVNTLTQLNFDMSSCHVVCARCVHQIRPRCESNSATTFNVFNYLFQLLTPLEFHNPTITFPFGSYVWVTIELWMSYSELPLSYQHLQLLTA